ncbi:MAG: hypothetical protein U1G05_14895 [Kiritimatiellia bacterium]
MPRPVLEQHVDGRFGEGDQRGRGDCGPAEHVAGDDAHLAVDQASAGDLLNPPMRTR